MSCLTIIQKARRACSDGYKDVSKVPNNDYGFMLLENGKYTALSSVNLLVGEKLIIEIIKTDLFSNS